MAGEKIEVDFVVEVIFSIGKEREESIRRREGSSELTSYKSCIENSNSFEILSYFNDVTLPLFLSLPLTFI